MRLSIFSYVYWPLTYLIHVFSVVKYVLKSFASFSIELSVFSLLTRKSSSYILDMNHLLVKCVLVSSVPWLASSLLEWCLSGLPSSLLCSLPQIN